MTENKHYTTGMPVNRIHNMTWHNETYYFLDAKSMVLFNEIFALFERVMPFGQNNARKVWFKVKRGNYTECGYENDEEACYYMDVEDPAKLQEAYEELYPRTEYWFQLRSYDNDGCRMLTINSLHIIVDPERKKGEFDIDTDLSEWLTWMKNGLVEILKECEEGTYNIRIAEELPYTLRYGIISRRALWDHRPEYREFRLKDLTEAEKEAFISLIKQNLDCKVPTARIKNMTFNKYFEYASAAFTNAGFDVAGMTPYEQFRRYGEDFGGHILEKLDHDSPDHFLRFYNREWDYAGHPWGLMRGSSRSRIMLYPERDNDCNENEFYFRFGADPVWSPYEIVKMYTALYEKGLPIVFSFPKEMMDYLREEDFVGFVTENDLCVYRQGSFRQRINDFYHFDPVADAPIKDIAQWQAVDYIHLWQK